MQARHITILLILLFLALTISLSGCTEPLPSPTVAPPPTTTPTPTVTLSVPELKYRLVANFKDVFWCDPDFYPIGRPGQEETNSIEQFPTIRANAAEFAAILKQLNLPLKEDYTSEEKLNIYREHKKLTYAVQMSASGEVQQFTLRVGEGQGQRIEGTVTLLGEIQVLKQEPSINTCPICLAEGTLIDTSCGAVPVERLKKGMEVWTLDDMGEQIAGVIIEKTVTWVPPYFNVVKVALEDGRSVIASAGHPAAGGKPLGEYQRGEMLDGARVSAIERIEYDASATYDILPSGGSGIYRANGVLLKSTLAR